MKIISLQPHIFYTRQNNLHLYLHTISRLIESKKNTIIYEVRVISLDIEEYKCKDWLCIIVLKHITQTKLRMVIQ
jgi:hypothetical protein